MYRWKIAKKMEKFCSLDHSIRRCCGVQGACRAETLSPRPCRCCSPGVWAERGTGATSVLWYQLLGYDHEVGVYGISVTAPTCAVLIPHLSCQVETHSMISWLNL